MFLGVLGFLAIVLVLYSFWARIPIYAPMGTSSRSYSTSQVWWWRAAFSGVCFIGAVYQGETTYIVVIGGAVAICAVMAIRAGR